MTHLSGHDRSQLLLLPEAVDDYVGPDNPVRFIDAFVDGLDLAAASFIHVEPKVTGRPGYAPADLLKLYIYGYLNRVRSSRRLEAETHRNIEVIWLLRHLKPDFKTIADFRRDNRNAFRRVFREFVLLCRQLDLFDRELLAVDGTRISKIVATQANRGKKIVRKRRQVRKRDPCVQSPRLRADRAVGIKRPQHSPGPGQRIRNCREVAPDQVDHLDAQHRTNIRENLGDRTRGGSLGDRGDRITHLPDLAAVIPAPFPTPGSRQPASRGGRRIVRREQRAPCLLVDFLLEAMGAADSPRLGDCRPGVYRMEPAADIGIGGKRGVVAGQHEAGPVNPAPAGYVGDRILFADDELATREVLVEHRVMALRLAAIAIDRIGQLFRGGALEVDRLARERPKTGSDEEQP